MKRLIAVATALGVLVTAGAAYAAAPINTYTANLPFTSKKAGTAKKPVPIGFTQNFTAAGTGGNRTAVLTDVKTKIYGIKVDGKDFPTCSMTKIANAHTDTVCPRGASVAKGSITASIGGAANFLTAGAPCDPLLDVWNAGQGKVVFFFVDTPTHTCVGLRTGGVPPYSGTYKNQGGYLVQDTPIPSYVGFPLPGVAGSLETEHLVWKSQTKKVKGKTVVSLASVACKAKKRPYSESFTATLPPARVTQSATVSESAACS